MRQHMNCVCLGYHLGLVWGHHEGVKWQGRMQDLFSWMTPTLGAHVSYQKEELSEPRQGIGCDVACFSG